MPVKSCSGCIRTELPHLKPVFFKPFKQCFSNDVLVVTKLVSFLSKKKKRKRDRVYLMC